MNQGLEKTSSNLVNQTFFERLHAKQGLVKKEFIRLKKIDADKQNQEKLQQRKSKDEYMVFNYLWRRFPEVMATKNQSPILLRQEIGDSEFEKILKAVRRFYGFRFYTSLTLSITSGVGAISSALSGFYPWTAFFGVCFYAGIWPLVITHIADSDPYHYFFYHKRNYREYMYKMLEKQND